MAFEIFQVDAGYSSFDVVNHFLTTKSSSKGLLILPYRPTSKVLEYFAGRSDVTTLAKIAFDFVSQKAESRPIIMHSYTSAYVKAKLGLESWTEAVDVLSVINGFINSSAKSFYYKPPQYFSQSKSQSVINPQFFLFIDEKRRVDSQYSKAIVAMAYKFWKKLESNDVCYTFESMIKSLQLGNPDFTKHDIIICLGFEDLSSCVINTIIGAGKHIVFLGDRCQALFTDDENSYEYSQLPFSVLSSCKNTLNVNFMEHFEAIRKRLGEDTLLKYGNNDDAFILPSTTLLRAANKPLHVFMSNMGVLDFTASMLKQDVPVRFLGGIDKCGISDLRDLCFLRGGFSNFIKSKYLVRDFVNYDGYVDVANKTNDPIMLKNIALVESELFNIAAINKLEQYEISNKSDSIFVSTVHRAKHSKFDIVCLGDDFFPEKEMASHHLKGLYAASAMASKAIGIPSNYKV